jgi:hypothetical protein
VRYGCDPDSTGRTGTLQHVNEKEMTILLRTERATFAVLAAEQLASWGDPAGKLPTHTRKLVRHATLPLVFGVAHSLWWVIPSPRKENQSTTLLEEFLRGIYSLDELNMTSIAHRLEAWLLPGFSEMKEPMYIAIALVDKIGMASVGLLMIQNPPRFVAGDGPPQVHPDGYYKQHDWDFLRDPGVVDPMEVARRARQLVEHGIAQDRALTAGQPRTCDGPVDVMLITANGANLV